MARVPVGEGRREEDVPLGGAGREARGGAGALDVEDDHGDLGEVGEAGELGHEGYAGARSRGHGPCPRPAGADGHPDGRQLVLGLDDGVGRLARRRVAPVLVEEAAEGLAEGGGGGDRVPGDDADAGEAAAQGGGGVPVHEDLPRVGVHRGALDAESAGRGEVLRRVAPAGVHGALVEGDGLRLPPEPLREGRVHLGAVHAEEAARDADIDHVHDEPAEARVGAAGLHELPEGDRVGGHVGTAARELHGLVVDHGTAREELRQVLLRGLEVHGDEEVGAPPARHVPHGREPDLEPGGKPLDVGGEDVLPGAGHPRLEDRPEEDHVRGLAPGPVHGADADDEVVHDGRCRGLVGMASGDLTATGDGRRGMRVDALACGTARSCSGPKTSCDWRHPSGLAGQSRLQGESRVLKRRAIWRGPTTTAP